MRIVRDENAQPPEVCDDNPHKIHRYSQSFLQTYYSNKSNSTEETVESHGEGGATLSAPSLPYVIIGHTILKKSSGDRLAMSLPSTVALDHSPTLLLKHATFFSEVEVIEYDLKDKVSQSTTVNLLV